MAWGLFYSLFSVFCIQLADMIKSTALRTMVEQYLEEDISAVITVSDNDGKEIPLLSLDKGAQAAVLENFMDWAEIQDSLFRKKSTVIN